MKWYLIPLVGLGSCAGLSTHLPDVLPADLTSEQILQEQQAFAEIGVLRDRLAHVSAPILKANTELCDRIGPDIGLVTHTVKNYPKRLRPAARRDLGAIDDPQILYVRAGSPADRAGLRPGDVMRDESGKPLFSPSKNLRKIIQEGQPLTYERKGKTREVILPLEEQCDYPVKLKMTSRINAYATGKSIIMTSGMMNFVKSDDELAAIISHELAHNEMGHIRKIITNLVLSGFATRYTRGFESEADYVGLYYSARAGYGIENVEEMWRRLAKLNVRPIVRPKTHPTFPDRYVRISAARTEIEKKQDAGKELIPNFKGTQND